MREIKFRAWIPDIERMYSVNSIEVNPNYNQSFSKLVVWEHPCERSAKIKGKLGVFRLTDEIPIMQYTGLKDKNGVEIYEGDLLENSMMRVVKVEWNEYQGCWDCVYVLDKKSVTGVGNSHGFRCRDWKNEVEVIGNIYENPELMKK